MKFLVAITLFGGATVMAQNGCGFPDGPDCVSLGRGANGLEQFADPDGCCLLPIRCGNEAGERCERVTTNNNAATGNGGNRNNGNGNGNNGNRNNGNRNNGNAGNNNAGNNNAGNNNAGNNNAGNNNNNAGNNADPNCGFPNGPDCTSLGNVNGLEQFADDGCCILPIRCGNIAGERCERVEVISKRRRSIEWTA